jgi:nitroreductase
MEFLEVIRKRYSVRAYKPDPVPEEVLGQLLEATQIAPTAANRQPFRIYVIPTEGREADLRKIYDPDWFVSAPLVICVCTVADQAWTRGHHDGKSYADVDAAIVMDHLILAATDADLGTCWIAAFDPAAARKVLELPADVEPVLFTPLGYPADEMGAKQRKPLADIVQRLD